MGYNRGGKRRTDRMRRRKKYENRLAQKMATEETPHVEGMGQKMKHLAQEAVSKVGDVLHSAVEKVKSVVK
jgi:hypothetical protein